MTFKELPIGASFDWINDERQGFNSFFDQCVKISARRYQSHTGTVYTVGSTRAEVYHVDVNGVLREGADNA